MSSGRVVVGGLLAVTVAVFAFVLTHSSDRGVGVRTASAKCIEDSGQDCLPALDLVDVDGKQWGRDELAGKVVMLNVWATWCNPCIEEIPALNEVYAQYRDRGFVLIGVLAETVSDRDLETFRTVNFINYPIVRHDADVMTALGNPGGLPTTFFYDRSGRRARMRVGAMNEAEVTETIEALLAGQ